MPVAAQRITGTPGSPSATTTINGKQLPPPPPKFGGKIEESYKNSTSWWPPRVVPPKGAPNVLLIMTDDHGYGVSSTFGGVIPTPMLDRIAAAGLRYTEFNSTALCSPTRAALITGRNHHSVGFGVITEISTGYPGYDSIIGPQNATIGRILADNGYATSWFGKDHNTPSFQVGPPGPFDQWPSGMGFQYFYGFVADLSVDWEPRLQPHHRHGASGAIQPVTQEVADSLGLKSAKGALVAEAQPNSPESAAGIKSSDVILGIDGERIDGPRDLARKVGALGPGKTAASSGRAEHC